MSKIGRLRFLFRGVGITVWVGTFYYEVGLFRYEVSPFYYEVGLFRYEVGPFYYEVGLLYIYEVGPSCLPRSVRSVLL